MVDEHIWRPGEFGQGREVTCMRPQDQVEQTAYAGWLDARQPEFRAQIKSAALDPFRGYATRCGTRCPTRCRCSMPATS